jgi:hypothetical protein
MGLFDFLKQPKWKSSKSTVRLAAVQAMQRSETDTLLHILRNDTDEKIQLAALARIDSPDIIENLLDESLSEPVLQATISRLENIYATALLEQTGHSDPQSLLQRITDQQLLADIALQANSVALRVHAVEKISEQTLLTELLQQPCGKKPALAAVKKITEPQLLQIIAEKGANKAARKQAAARLSSKKQNSPSDTPTLETAPQTEQPITGDTAPAAHTEERINTAENLLQQIEELCTNMGEGAEETFAAIVRKWPDLSDIEETRKVQELERGYQDLCIRYSTTHKDFLAETALLKELHWTCEQIKNLLRKDNLTGAETLLNETFTDFENKSWHWVNSTELGQRLISLRQDLAERQDELTVIANRENEQLEKAAALCEQMEQLATATERYQLEKQEKKVKQCWDRLPSEVKELHFDLTSRFKAASAAFQEKQQAFYKEQEWQMWSNKTKKEELLANVAALQEEDDLHLVAKKLKNYQATWKTIGPVPKKDSSALWEQFKTSCDTMYERCREFYSELDQKRQQVTKIKESFCEQAEEHAESENWKESAEFLKNLQKQWKETGPAEREQEEKLYTRFRKACDTFFDRRSAFFTKQDAIRQDNFALKEGLCAEVEALVKNPCRETGAKIKEIQQTWKSIGPVPRKFDEEIWKRFRSSCDIFYNWLDEQRQKNLALKTSLCEQVEALLPETVESSIDQETINQVIALQKEWKTIGPVPREQSDSIWNRFTTTCDIFFAERKILAQEAENKRLENQQAKEEILRLAGEAMELSTEQEITERLKELQKQWKEIGPAPREHEQILWDEFHGLCNAFFQKKRERYLEKTTELENNLKKKEELCFQLERLAGEEPDITSTPDDKGIDLVEQFRIARESNFMLAGKTDNTRGKREEVRRIQQEWKKVGTTFREQEQKLWKRYRRAIDKIYASGPSSTRTDTLKKEQKTEDQATTATTTP